MKVYKKKDKIIFEIPYWSKRSNPYMPDADVGRYKTLTAIIEGDEIGWAKTIDMGYSGKPDQHTPIMVHCWDIDKEDFIKLNKRLEIPIYEYPICAYCGKSIYGAFTIGEKGNMCYECETRENK